MEKELRTDEFKNGNEEFREKWYFHIVKYITFSLIVFGYILSFAMFLCPFIGWYLENIRFIFAGVFILLFSPHTFKYTREMHQNSVKYFRN